VSQKEKTHAQYIPKQGRLEEESFGTMPVHKKYQAPI
jgi:hypothetical protein